jgi:hypothetical protein
MRRDPTFRSFYNWSLAPEDPRQPQKVEIDVTAKLLDKPQIVIVEFVRTGHLRTAGPRRKYQHYRFLLKHVLECRGDAEWQRQAEEITGAFWYRGNAHNRKRKQ